jgi:hypothetical protein
MRCRKKEKRKEKKLMKEKTESIGNSLYKGNTKPQSRYA